MPGTAPKRLSDARVCGDVPADPDALLLRLVELRGSCTYQSLKSLVSGGWMPGAGTPDEILDRMLRGGHLVRAADNPRHYVRPASDRAATSGQRSARRSAPPRRASPRRASPRAHADRLEAALPASGSIKSGDLARAAGLRPDRTTYKAALALLVEEGRVACPQPTYYTRPGQEHTHSSLPNRIVWALQARGPLSYRELGAYAEPASQASVSSALGELLGNGQIERIRYATYAMAGTTPPQARARSVKTELRAIFADGRTHRTQDLVDRLCVHASTETVRNKIKRLGHDGEIVNVARGVWRINDGTARARDPFVPAIARLRQAIAELEGTWSRRDALAVLARRGDTIARGTINKALLQLQQSGEIEQTQRGRYRHTARRSTRTG